MTGSCRGSPPIGRRRPSSHACRSLVLLMTTLCPPFFLLVTKCLGRYQFTLNQLVLLAYLVCVPVWRAPGGTRTHISGKLLGPSVLAKNDCSSRTDALQRSPAVLGMFSQGSWALCLSVGLRFYLPNLMNASLSR